jgi:hypothetical protein
MSEAPPSCQRTKLRSVRFAKSDDDVRFRRDLREKLLVNWFGAEDLQQPQSAWGNPTARTADAR